MKKILALFIISGTFVFLFMSSVQATPFNVYFGDSVRYWPGWNNGSYDDSRDLIGTPEIRNDNTSYASISDIGDLMGVWISYTSTSSFNANAGSLFIDVGADQDWDYVLTSGNTNKFIYDFISTPFSALKGGANNSLYRKSNYYYGSSGLNYRQSHPVSLNTEGLTSAGTYSNFINFTPIKGYSGYVEFSGFNLDLKGQDFIIGFGPTCANDVIYEEINNPVPEPATLILLSSGLICLAGFRKSFRKS